MCGSSTAGDRRFDDFILFGKHAIVHVSRAIAQTFLRHPMLRLFEV